VDKIMAAFPLFGLYIHIFLHMTYISLNKKKIYVSGNTVAPVSQQLTGMK
jgi:hypothetical protein